jgi:Cell Wall Hydrolase
VATSSQFFTPEDKPTLASHMLGLVIALVALGGLSMELSRPSSRIGWGLRVLHDVVRPTIHVVDPVVESLRRLAITEADIDIMVRTVIGEAANEPDEGKIAVTWVILTRAMQNVRWYGGNSVTNVSLHKSTRVQNGRTITTWQFEPWMSRRDYLWRISRHSRLYSHVRSIVVGCINGTHTDITDGATHFLEPNVVMKRSGKLPAWAQDEGRRIGNHVFFKHGQPTI